MKIPLQCFLFRIEILISWFLWKIIPEYSWLGPRTATIDHSLEKNNIHNQRGPNWSLLRSWVVKKTMSKNLDLLGLFDAWKKSKNNIVPRCWWVWWWWLPYGRIRQQKSHQQTLNKSKFMVKGQHSNRSRCAVFLHLRWGTVNATPGSKRIFSHGTCRGKKLADDGRCDQAGFCDFTPKNGFRPNAVKPGFLSNKHDRKITSVTEIWHPCTLGKV